MNDPYKIEVDMVSLLKDRNCWRTGQGFKDLNPKQFQEKMKETYKYLYDTSETLFKGSFDGMFDTPVGRTRIKHMLSLMKEIYDGKKKQEDVDKQLGKELADEYVNPIVDKLEKDKK
tara:strand:+ start:173 stop:523 length:351 start_codon:yes stop_codon:yes gene_type:complete